MPSVKVPMPDIHLNVAMDVRKWSWPGALSFGRGVGTTSPQIQQPGSVSVAEEKTETEQHESDSRSISDGESKQIEGLPNNTDFEPFSERNSTEIDQEEHSPTSVAEATPTTSQMVVPSVITDSPRPSLESMSVEEPPPELLSTLIHLPREAGLVTETISTKIIYFKVIVD